MSDRESGSGSFWFGFLLGAAAGIGAALIAAPRSGEETIAMLRERGLALKKQADEMGTQARERAEDQWHHLQEDAGERLSEWETRGRDVWEQAEIKLTAVMEKEDGVAIEDSVADAMTELVGEDAAEGVAEAIADAEAEAEAVLDQVDEEWDVEEWVEVVEEEAADVISMVSTPENADPPEEPEDKAGA